MSKKLVIVCVAVAVLFMCAMGAGLFILSNKISSMNAQMNASAEEEGKEALEANVMGPMVPLDTFIVNLADKGGNRYLRLSMDLELEDESTKEELSLRTSQIRDGILMLVTTRSVETIQTTKGKNDLRGEIIEQMNGILKGKKVKNIFFTEFVIQ